MGAPIVEHPDIRARLLRNTAKLIEVRLWNAHPLSPTICHVASHLLACRKKLACLRSPDTLLPGFLLHKI